MKYIVTSLFVLFVSCAVAQEHWNKLPAYTTSCYSEKDPSTLQLTNHLAQVQKQLDQLQQAQERKMQNMSEAERTQLAMKAATQYQNMSADAIRNMQEEQMLMATLQQETQTKESEVLERLTEAQDGFREKCEQHLEPIIREYRKLPDGEGTPDWAIEKGKELMQQYKREYEKICHEFITGPTAKFKPLLDEYKRYQQYTAIPNNLRMLEFQMKQYGLPVTQSDGVVLEGVKAYLNKVKEVYDLRQLYQQ